MSICDISKKKVFTLSKSEPIWRAAKLMKDEGVGSIIITHDEEGEEVPIGIITDRDVAIKVVAEKRNAENIKISEIMSGDLLIIDDDQDIRSTIELMKKKGVRRAPVMNDDDEICGIISLDDLFVYMTDELNNLADVVQKQIKG